MISTLLAGIIGAILLFVDTESLIRYGGLLMACLIVYGSTGLFFCFFLPSGAILFTAGVLTATGDLHQDIITVCSLLALASVCGNMTSYGFGRHAGRVLYSRKESKFFRRKHLLAAEVFYNKYGGWALTIGFFLPVIRTFAPVVAGMIKLDLRRFMVYTFIGSVAWIVSFVIAGYIVGNMPFIKPWLHYIVIGFILCITLPLLVRIIKEMRKLR